MLLPVDDDGVRPAGDPNFCFYCGMPKGKHKDDCVCRQRTVVVEMTIRYVSEVPADWDVHMIEFHKNESSFCLGNDIEQLHQEKNARYGYCNICQRAEVKFIREATADDHEELAWNQRKEGRTIDGQATVSPDVGDRSSGATGTALARRDPQRNPDRSKKDRRVSTALVPRTPARGPGKR